MKSLALLLLLPAVALAEAPAQPAPQIDPQQFFEQSKKMMLPMMEESLPVMRQARECLNGASDQASFDECVKIMQDLDEKMRTHLGSMHGGAVQDKEMPKVEPKSIEWSAETQQKLVQFLDRSISVGDATSECLKQSTQVEQMQQCMQAKQSQLPPPHQAPRHP